MNSGWIEADPCFPSAWLPEKAPIRTLERNQRRRNCGKPMKPSITIDSLVAFFPLQEGRHLSSSLRCAGEGGAPDQNGTVPRKLVFRTSALATRALAGRSMSHKLLHTRTDAAQAGPAHGDGRRNIALHPEGLHLGKTSASALTVDPAIVVARRAAASRRQGRLIVR